MANFATRSLFRAVLIALVLAASGAAFAKSFPARAVHFVIGLPPGTSTGTTLRVIAHQLGKMWHQSVVVMNRPGASGNIAAGLVARATPDGYTLLFSNSAIGVAPSYYKHLTFDPLKDLAPVSEVSSMPETLCVHPTLRVHSLKELISLAKSKPNGLKYGSLGPSQSITLATLMFEKAAGIKMLNIPYNGYGQLLRAVISGEVDVVNWGLPSILPHVRAKKVRCLAIMSTSRSPAAPNLPTVAGSGFPGFEASVWAGVFAPAGTPRAIVDKISRDVAVALKAPAVRKHMTTFGLKSIGSTPDQFATFYEDEVAKWGKVLKANGIRGD